MKTKKWLLEAKGWTEALPIQVIETWEEKNPDRKIVRTLDLLEKGMRLGNYFMVGIAIVCLLAALQFFPGVELKEYLLWFLIPCTVLWAMLGILDIWAAGPETRIEHFMGSIAAMRKCGLVPVSIDGSQKIDLKTILEFARARLTQNARFVLNAQVTLKNLEGSGLDVEIVVASESVLTFQQQLNHALDVAVGMGLSTGVKTHYFNEATKRK